MDLMRWAIRTQPKLTTVRELQQFLGLANYYAQYIHHYADIAALLTDLASPKRPQNWGTDQDRAFDQICESLCNLPVLDCLILNCHLTQTQMHAGILPALYCSCSTVMVCIQLLTIATNMYQQNAIMVGARKICWPYTSRVLNEDVTLMKCPLHFLGLTDS